MAKRESGTGSVTWYPARRRYIGSLRLTGKTPIVKTVPKIAVASDANYVRACRWWDRYLANLETGNAEAGRAQAMTVAQYAEFWLDRYRKSGPPPNSYRHREAVYRVRIVPALGRAKLTDLTPGHIATFYAMLRNATRTIGRKPHQTERPRYTDSTIDVTAALLHKLLQDAWKLDRITKENVADGVPLPAVTVPSVEAAIVTGGMFSAFRLAIAGHRFEWLYLLAHETGLRVSELRALRWQDITFDRNRLAVTGTVARNLEGVWERYRPKGKKSRTVALSELAIEALRAQRVQVAKLRLAAADWQDRDLVFPDEVGGYLSDSSILYHLRRQLATIGMPAIKTHALRHSFATASLEEGASMKAVSAALGHSSSAITERAYIHVTDRLAEEVAEAMNRRKRE